MREVATTSASFSSRARRAREAGNLVLCAAAGRHGCGDLRVAETPERPKQPLDVADPDALGDVGRPLPRIPEADLVFDDVPDEGVGFSGKPSQSQRPRLDDASIDRVRHPNR